MRALEGLDDAKPAHQRFWDRHASPISILILGSLLLAAVLGFTGGQPSPPRTADFGEARLMVKTPVIIRNGEFFETDLTLTAEARSEEHTSELQSLMRISYAVFCLKKKTK